MLLVCFVFQQTWTRQTFKKIPFVLVIIALNRVLLPPTERRIKPRYCVDGVGIVSKFCTRLSAETDPDSE